MCFYTKQQDVKNILTFICKNICFFLNDFPKAGTAWSFYRFFDYCRGSFGNKNT